MPAQPVHRARVALAGPAQRHRRQIEHVRRIRGIARQPGDAGHAVVLGEIRLQGPIVDRPVVGHAVERAHAEVGGMQARIVRREHDRATADAVEVRDLHRRVVVVDRIVGGAAAAVRAHVEVAVAARLPIAAVARKIGRLDPVALLQAQDAHARVGQAPGDRSARRPRRSAEGPPGHRSAEDPRDFRTRQRAPSTSRHRRGRPRTGSSRDQSPAGTVRPSGYGARASRPSARSTRSSR